jgi:hypothetical protein
MTRWLVGVVLATGLSVPGPFARGDDAPQAEPLPPPQRVVPEPPLPAPDLPPYPAFERRNRYDVWQDYAVNRQGRWRARVVYSPAGAYYHYNHEPYPYTPIRAPLQFMPYATD